MKQHHTPTENEDKVWDILNQAPPQQASPLFARNVVRAVRLSQGQEQSPWWKKILNRKTIIILTSCAACAAIGIPMIFAPSNLTPLPIAHDKTEVLPVKTEVIDDTELFEAIVEDDDMVSEFLVVISENPEILSQEEIASLMNF